MYKSKPKICSACRSIREPFIGHDIRSCRKIAPDDRPNVIKSFALDVGEFSDNEDEPPFREEYDNAGITVESNVLDKTSVQRIDIVDSPTILREIEENNGMVLDTGAKGSMISLDLCKISNHHIYPSSHSAMLANGDSQLTVEGEVHTSITMNDLVNLPLNALVVTKLKAGLIVGMSFLKQHGVVIDIPNHALLVQGFTIHFNNKQGRPKVSLLRTEVSRVVVPDENVMLPVPTNVLMYKELAVEPREFGSSWPEPFVLKYENGFGSIPNTSNKSVKFKKNQVIGQIRLVVMPPHVPLNNTIKTAAGIKSTPSLTKEILSKDDKSLFHDINKKYSSVISPNYKAYNNKSGETLGDGLMGTNIPPPCRGKVPSYNSNQSDILQPKFDEPIRKSGYRKRVIKNAILQSSRVERCSEKRR